jgi:hypothetical protein
MGGMMGARESLSSPLGGAQARAASNGQELRPQHGTAPTISSILLIPLSLLRGYLIKGRV